MDVSPDDVQQLAAEAFTYLYPLVTMDVTRTQLTDVSEGGAGHAHPNSFAHVETFPPADFREVVSPNFDTLYSTAWLDLSSGPLVVHVPDTAGRYYLLPLLDMWTDVFASPGKRTSGTGEASFLVSGPGWSGTVPRGVTHLSAPTAHVWVIGRVQTNGPSDYRAVHAVQAGMTIRTIDGGEPSHSRGPAAAPAGLDMSEPALRLVNGMDAVDFFTYGNRLLAQNPPHLTDFSVLARIARIGVGSRHNFDVAALGEGGVAALDAGKKQALAEFAAVLPQMGTIANGWSLNTNSIGVYGNYYLKRAIVAMVGLGANPPEDAIYPFAVADATGAPTVGGVNYLLHFDAADLPPVSAFWSLTMYDAEGFQIANPLNRFAIGGRDSLRYGSDGSLDLHIQPDDPGGDRSANWLPSPPSGAIRMMLRLYAPALQALDGRWVPPAITIA